MLVIGFSGLPVRASVGIRQPVTYDPDTEQYQIASSRNSAVPRDEFNRLVAEGYAVRLPKEWPAVDGNLVLYAHREFLYPGEGLPLAAFESILACHGDSLLYAGYLARAECLSVIRRWAKDLIQDAERALGQSHVTPSLAQRALGSALRARSCALLEVDRELRFQAFLCLAIARRLLDLPWEPLFEDAALDFSKEKQDELRVNALRRFLEIPYGSVSHREPHHWVDRSALDASAQMPRQLEE